MTAILEARNLGRQFIGGDGAAFTVLDQLDLTVESGEFVAIIGASGCGKSTLLHLLGALDTPNSGEILLEGQSYPPTDLAAVARIRNRRLGFVFQFHHLLRDFNAVENVMMPLLIRGMDLEQARSEALTALESLGVGGKALSRTAVLSGGEQQRVAVARALVHHPAVLLADEPTGNLDPPTATALHEMLGEVARERGTAMVVVTHNRELAMRADRVLELEGGSLGDARTAGTLP